MNIGLTMKTLFFFSKWEEIKTEKYLIDIKQRPEIIDLAFKIEPPEYTGLKNYSENYKNVNQIIIPNGSKVLFLDNLIKF